MPKKIIIGVMGPGTSATATDLQMAYELGQQIAAAGWVLLSGGRSVGVMEAVSRGAKAADGLTVGILPNSNTTGMSDAIDIAIFTDMGNARNTINVLSSDVVIACGMGTGTASEVALALKAHKPTILLGWDRVGQAFFQQLSPAPVEVAETVEDAIALVRHILADRDRTP